MSVKHFARNSGPGNGCANLMGAWNCCVLSADETSMPVKFPVLGGGVCCFFFFGGGGADFIFMGTGLFLKKLHSEKQKMGRIAENPNRILAMLEGALESHDSNHDSESPIQCHQALSLAAKPEQIAVLLLP